MQFHLIVVSIFKKRVWKIMKIAPANCYKEGFDKRSILLGVL